MLKLLYHFSEEPNISLFTPRLPKAFPELPLAVWAIDKEHSINYCFPRDCPRVIYWKAEWTDRKIKVNFFQVQLQIKLLSLKVNGLNKFAILVYMYTH